MKRLKIIPLSKPVKTAVHIPGSKSYTNRALLLAAMTEGNVKLTDPLYSDDTKAMISCLEQLGIDIAIRPSYLEVKGDISSVSDKDYNLNADISGTTMRFMAALCAVIPGRQTIHGGEGLHKRPISQLVDGLRQIGANIEYLGKDGHPPLLISEPELAPGTVKVNKTVSSQYVSALLMIAPLVGEVTVKVSGELISKPFVDMTIAVMQEFGVAVDEEQNNFRINGNQSYQTTEYRVEGDVSSAAYFWAIAALTGSTITAKNINPESRQADMEFLNVLKKMGNKVSFGPNAITIIGSGVEPIEVDMRNCPDQAQTLAAMAASAGGTTTITGIESLRIKETERIKALQQELKKMGIKTEASADSLIIHGGRPKAASIATYGDHRMAMSFAVAGTKLAGMEIQDPDVVTKTFPDFWKKLSSLGVGVKPIQPNIVLIGMRGSGKTTVANLLAKKLQIEHLDLDTIMSEKMKMATAEIVAEHGWDHFRRQESTIAEEVSKLDNKLISTGGGVVTKPRNVKALKRNGVLILLRASADTLIKRLGSSKDRPPLTKASSLRAEVEQVLHVRQKLYENAAEIIIDTDDLNPNQVVERIILEVEKRV